MNDELRIIRTDADLFAATGLRRTARTDLMKAGRFPKPIRLSPRCRGWTAKALADWLAQRAEEGDRAVEMDHEAIQKMRAVERGDRKLRQIKREQR